ncbi:MAG: TPM domain-containing protein [Polyangia bacterium]
MSSASEGRPADKQKSTTLDRLLHPRDQHDIILAIRTAELYTTGELKVHVEARCRAADPYSRAVEVFDQLGLHRTEQRNGVLVYVAIHDRRFCIVGDSGIGAPPGHAMWTEAQQRLSVAFRRGAFGEGIVGAVSAIGEKLARRFPARPGPGKDEIDNEISTAETGGS